MFNPNHEQHLVALQEQLRKAHAVTPDLMARVMAQACVRVATYHATSRGMINRLIESGAWTDAALALIEVELPRWRPRRLVCEDGQWHCSLSQHPELPIGLDQPAEATHDILPLALLTAFLEARRSSFATVESRFTPVPQIQPAQEFALCCDNFR